MKEVKTSRIQILTGQEIDELYSCPVFNQAEREEYLSLNPEIKRTLARLEKVETRVYLILLIGYFRTKPVVPKFKLRDVKQDVEYIYSTYFPDKKIKYSVIKKNTRATLILKMYSILGFERFSKQHQQALIARLQDVATICTYPKYIFDECLAFFGQKRIGLAGYSTLQSIITNVLASERHRTEDIISCHMTDTTQAKLQKILHTKGLLNSLSLYKGSAKDFSPSQLAKEVDTHNTIKEVYQDVKHLIEKLGLSQGNLDYYASIIHHQSVYKIRRYPKWQGMLYMACHLFLRYRETNDKLVAAFQYITRKQGEAAKAAAKQRIAEELEVIRDKLKCAGNILKLFVDDDISDKTEFGEIRQDAFSVISKAEIQLISKHLHQNSFDKTLYEWQFIDTQYRKIANSMRSLFMAIDIDCDPSLQVLASQLTTSKLELSKDKKMTTVDQRLLSSQDKKYLLENNQVNTKRFEYYLYQRVAKLINHNSIYVTESADNKRLEDDLIPQIEWKESDSIIQKSGLPKLSTPIDQTLSGLMKKLRLSIKHLGNSINDDANDLVKRQPRINQLTWTLANKRWKDDLDNPVYTQI